MKTFSVPFICETGSMVAKPSLPSNIKLLGSWNSQLGAAELVTGYSNPSGVTHKTVLVGSSPCQPIQYESNYVPNPRSLASRFLFFISIGFLHLLQHTELSYDFVELWGKVQHSSSANQLALDIPIQPEFILKRLKILNLDCLYF